MLKRLLREPLIHFLLLGAALFATHSWISKPGRDESGRIVITQGQITSLRVRFTRTLQRPPSPEEMEGLIRDLVQEEVYCREAIALGLDKDDTIIRRRLRQKMEFVTDDIAGLSEPTDADLNVFLQAHPDLFRLEPKFTFRQLYLNPARHGENLTRDFAQLLAQVQQAGAKADVSELGDASQLEHEFQYLPASEATKQFGEKFAAQLAGLPSGQSACRIRLWIHLVRVSDRTEATVPALTQVRENVKRAWASERRLDSNEKFYHELLKRYTVTVEKPAAEELIETGKKMARAE